MKWALSCGDKAYIVLRKRLYRTLKQALSQNRLLKTASSYGQNGVFRAYFPFRFFL